MRLDDGAPIRSASHVPMPPQGQSEMPSSSNSTRARVLLPLPPFRAGRLARHRTSMPASAMIFDAGKARKNSGDVIGLGHCRIDRTQARRVRESKAAADSAPARQAE